jgi:CBS domain containing-hemolysin-like protein/mannitol/fructose-specific phosphotransferase system IIA component
MELLLLGAAVLVLIGLNAFFVLAEFAIVRVRPTRVAELFVGRVAGAHTLDIIQKNLDEHLGVCQVGITLASVALGVVGQRGAELMGDRGTHWYRYVLAMALSYVVVTGSHVVLGEMVPKAIAIRMADRIALRVAAPLRLFRTAFYPALWLFNAMATLVTRLLGLPRATDQERHTEQEVRIILEHFEEGGHMSFRRLLLMESIFDFGTLRVKDVMRPRVEVRQLRMEAAWSDNLAVIRSGRFSRYPLVGSDAENPIGFVHVKDVLLRAAEGAEPKLADLARPCIATTEGATLESLLAKMQRGVHAALVRSPSGAWTGFVTLEDLVEEIVGTIRDEFDEEEPARLGDIVDLERIQLGIEGASLVAAVSAALDRIPRAHLPFPSERIALAIDERERTAGTYVGGGIAIPHARLAHLKEPFVMIVRSTQGIPCAGTDERAYLLFVIITPAGQPRVHQRLLQTVAMILHEGHHVTDRLRAASTPQQVLEILTAGEQAAVNRVFTH